jgi:ribosome assembly protein 4
MDTANHSCPLYTSALLPTYLNMSDNQVAALSSSVQDAAEKRKGGIAWGGSLVGANNPNNFGYRYSTPSKRYRAESKTEGGRDLPTSIQVRFKNRQGEELAHTIDIPLDSTIDDLTALVHSLIEESEGSVVKNPYSFYAKLLKNGVEDDIEITSTLLDFLQKEISVSTEAVLELTYQPLAVFRVRPVSRCTDTLPGHTEAVLHVQYSPDGRMLASGGGDTTVRFWDINTSTPKYTCRGHKNHVLCTSWSPDGKRFVSADKNGVVIFWDPFKGESVGKHLKAHKQWITSMAWEPMHLNAQCDRLATAGKDGTIRIWNVRTQSLITTLSGHTDSVEAVRWGGEGLIYSASRDRTIKAWNADRGILVRTLVGHAHRINTLALDSDYVTRTGPFDHRCLKFASQEEAHRAAIEKYKTFRANGVERMISGSDDFTLFLWNPTESKHPVKRLTGHQQAINHIAFSPDGRYIASASFDKKTKIWNGYSGDFMLTLTGHVGAVYQVAWSSDSRLLVTASKDSTAKLWEVPSGKRARETLPGHADEVYALDWSPNGSAVATGSKDRTIKLWKH